MTLLLSFCEYIRFSVFTLEVKIFNIFLSGILRQKAFPSSNLFTNGLVWNGNIPIILDHLRHKNGGYHHHDPVDPG